MFKLQDIQIPRGQEAATCICDICVARRTQFRKVKIVPGAGKTQNDEKPVKTVPCLKCLQTNNGPGIPHPCGTSQQRKNIANIILKEGKHYVC